MVLLLVLVALGAVVGMSTLVKDLNTVFGSAGSNLSAAT